jgi:hypothetical protein
MKSFLQELKKGHTTEINAFVNAGDVLHFYN